MKITSHENFYHENFHLNTKQIMVSFNSYTTINTPYNWPAFLAASCLNIGYFSSHELTRIRN